jgi:hypothetical protein
MLAESEHIQFGSCGNSIVELKYGCVPAATFCLSQPALNVSWHESRLQLAVGSGCPPKKLLQS